MRGRHLRMAIGMAMLLLRATAGGAVTPGQPLAAALQELRVAGLQLIFSSALIKPSFTVKAQPGAGSTPEQIARGILAPYGLTLKTLRPGWFAVVKQSPDSQS